MRITVFNWFDDEVSEPRITMLSSENGSSWQTDEGATVDLSEVLNITDYGALRINFDDGTPNPWQFALALPWLYPDAPVRQTKTGDRSLDRIKDCGGPPVLINGKRWGLLPSWHTGQWAPCKPPHHINDGEDAQVKHRRTIARVSIEFSDETAEKSFEWTVLEVDDLACCITFYEYDPICHEERVVNEIHFREGRTDRELASKLVEFIEVEDYHSEAIKKELFQAITNGGCFKNYIRSRDPDLDSALFSDNGGGDGDWGEQLGLVTAEVWLKSST